MQLALPRFKMTRLILADAALRALGMAKVFTPDADLTGIASTKPLFISSVVHKAFVEVNEEGTEAAAATALVVRGAGAPQAGPAVVRADRPSLFLIRDRKTGAILFLGRLADPTAWGESAGATGVRPTRRGPPLPRPFPRAPPPAVRRGPARRRLHQLGLPRRAQDGDLRR